MSQQTKAAEGENCLVVSEFQAPLGLPGDLLSGVQGIAALNMSVSSPLCPPSAALLFTLKNELLLHQNLHLYVA